MQDVKADAVVISCINEQITVLNGHQPFMNCLAESEIKFFKCSPVGTIYLKTINIKSGLVKMYDNELVILSSEIKE